MKLRSRLLISSGALITVALAGLALSMFSVMQLTKTQNQTMTRNLQIIDATLRLRQEVGGQVSLVLSETLDSAALKRADDEFNRLLRAAGEVATEKEDQQALLEISRAYQDFSDMLDQPFAVRSELMKNNRFSSTLQNVRNRINDVQTRYVGAVQRAQDNATERAILITWLLGLISLAVLLIGFVTANSIAQRFGRPIEALALAADRIGQGDFHVTLPISPVAELSALSRRFGLMAEALRQLKSSNVDALLSEQRRLQAVLDSIDDGLLILNRDGLLEHFNPVAQRQLAWTSDQLGMSLGEALQRPELNDQVQAVLRGESADRNIDDLEVEAQGETRLLTYSMTPVSHSEGRILGAVLVLRDVTEQRAFDRVRNEFVLRASHELRTPVTGMHMAFALLQERLKFAPEAREADLVRTVDEEMHRLVRLINDLLNFSRYQSGMQKLELAFCDIGELLQQSRERFSAQADERQIELLVEVNEELPQVRVDRLQIERVLDNLIGNALRHSHTNGCVRLQARRQDGRVIFSVTDEGEGIAYNQQARIFEPFVQVGRRKGGAGLGLALCKEIILLHGGRIGVNSTPGEGTQFYMTLPL